MKSTFKRIKKQSSSSTSTTSTSYKGTAASNDILIPSSSLMNLKIDRNFNVEDRFCSQLLPWKFKSKEEQTLKELLSVYHSYDEYIANWEPMILEEIRANVLNTLSSKRSTKDWSMGYLRLSNFLGPETKHKLKLLQYTINFSPDGLGNSINERDEIIKISNMDLVLFTYETLQSPMTMESLSNISSSSYLLGFITSSRKNEFFVKVLNSEWNQFVTFTQAHEHSKFVNTPGVLLTDTSANSMNCRIKYIILDSLTSSSREYHALFSLHKSKLLSTIIQLPTDETPPQSPTEAPDSNEEENDHPIKGIGEALYPKLKEKYNKSQLDSIRICVDDKEEGLTLIQGPPGTGKTTTILGIMNTLHVKYFNSSYTSAIATILGEEGLKCRNSNKDDYATWINMTLTMKRPRILVLAPSNVAVDNIVEKVLEYGFIDGKGSQYWPSMLRLGSGSKQSKVRVISLEETTESFLSMEREEVRKIREGVIASIKRLVQDIFNLQTLLLHMKDAFLRYPLPLHVELRVDFASARPYWVDHKNRTTLTSPPVAPMEKEDCSQYTYETLPEYIIYTGFLAPLLDQLRHQSLQQRRLLLRDQLGDRSFSYKTLIETSLIDDAHVVFTTLNSSGHSCLDSSVFDAIIIDEAAQCTEPSILIPLRLPCEKCLLVGDPMQLPATTFSNRAKNLGYDQSLFERLMGNGHQVTLLNTQYRMHPQISAFPSEMFYGGRLLNGSNVTDPSTCPSYINNTSFQLTPKDTLVFPPFVFFDLISSKDEVKNSFSRSNYEEALFCVNSLKLFIRNCALKGAYPASIGIITPYSEQLQELRRMISKINWDAEVPVSSTSYVKIPDIELNTVDSFQGREKDVVFISCVRSNDSGSIGFLSDVRRMNVALTRSKFGLYVIGNAETLRGNPMWAKLIAHAEANRVLITVRRATDNIESSLRRIGVRQYESKEESTAASNNSTAKVVIIRPNKFLAKKRKAAEVTKDAEEGEILEDSV